MSQATMSQATISQTVDVQIEHHGIYTFEPLTDAGREWLDENAAAESWQWLGGRLCVEDRRNAIDLAQAMLNDGLIVK